MSAPGRDRTCDRRIKSPLLYQLSYKGLVISIYRLVALSRKRVATYVRSMTDVERRRLENLFRPRSIDALIDELGDLHSRARQAPDWEQRKALAVQAETRKRQVVLDLLAAREHGIVADMRALQPLLLRLRSQSDWGLD